MPYFMLYNTTPRKRKKAPNPEKRKNRYRIGSLQKSNRLNRNR